MSEAHREGSRLVLVRHGRSSHVHVGWITASGLRAWRDAYEAAGIREDERVPGDIEQLANGADVVLCSDAARAVASARLLAPGREIIVSPLLRERELEGPALGAIRLPLAAWAVAVGARALLLTLLRKYPPPAEAARVDDAAAWLEELAAQHSLIIAVTHASFRRQLSARLMQTGWYAESTLRSMKHWSMWHFRRSPDPRHLPSTGSRSGDLTEPAELPRAVDSALRHGAEWCVMPKSGERVFDFVIVGAGSAGCVLAARLSEDAR